MNWGFILMIILTTGLLQMTTGKTIALTRRTLVSNLLTIYPWKNIYSYPLIIFN